MKFIEEMNINIGLNTNICKIISSNLSSNQTEGGPSVRSRVGVVFLSFGSFVSVYGVKGVPIGPCSSGFYIPLCLHNLLTSSKYDSKMNLTSLNNF